MSTTQSLTDLVTHMQTCASNSGFNTFKFGKLEHINFDHNITYDLLNVEYPTSRIEDISSSSLSIYTFRITAARPTLKDNSTGVQVLDNVHLIMSALEKRIWNFLSCFGGTNNCNNVIPADTITMDREKGVFNDNLVTVTCLFNIEVFSDCLEIECSKAGKGDPPPGDVEDSWNCVKTLLYDPNELSEDEIAELEMLGEAFVYSCVDPGDGTGTYGSLQDCQDKCGGRNPKGGGGEDPRDGQENPEG